MRAPLSPSPSPIRRQHCSHPLGLVPYVPAAITWIAIGFCLYLAAVGAIIPRFSTLAVAATAPTARWAVFTMQTGFFTAALIGGSLVLLERRKVAAGTMLGLLIFKPHFAILFPVVLIAARQWRVLASAIVAMTALVVASLLAFGSETWIGFYRSLIDTSSVNLVGGNMGRPTIESFFGVVRSIGGSAELAWTCHAVVAATTALGVCWLWRRDDISYSLKASALSLGTFVVTPYLRGYDLVGLAIPFAFLVRSSLESGFLRGERTALVGLLIGSSLLVSFGQPLPCGPALIAALGLWIALHVRQASPAPAPDRDRHNVYFRA